MAKSKRRTLLFFIIFLILTVLFVISGFDLIVGDILFGTIALIFGVRLVRQ